MKAKGLILAGTSLALVLALASSLISGCARPAPTPAPAPAPTPTLTPTPAAKPTPTPPWKPPEYITIGSGATGTALYAANVASGGVIEEATRVKVVVKAYSVTAARATALKEGTAHFAFGTSQDTWTGLKGILDFQTWGPQSFRVVWKGGTIDQGFVVRANSGIRTWNDLKGKRVCSYEASPTNLIVTDAMMAYAGLSWKDLISVPVSSTAKGRTAVIEGAADMALFSASSSGAQELAASPHGLYWLPMPNITPEDKAAWARWHKIEPTWYPVTRTDIVGSSPQKPAYVIGHPIPGYVYDWTDENLVYWFVKQLHEQYNAYKDKHPDLKTWNIEETLNIEIWYAPLHEGAIRYFKDIGQWTLQMEKKQQELLALYPQRKTK